MDKTTLTYYNTQAKDFVQGTVAVDFHITQDRFLAQLAAGASILDFGCGSGRDTKYFLRYSYDKNFLLLLPVRREQLTVL